jgi:hypothetical protein
MFGAPLPGKGSKRSPLRVSEMIELLQQENPDAIVTITSGNQPALSVGRSRPGEVAIHSQAII